MAMTRIYFPESCAPNATITLPTEASQHVLKVLRHQIGDSITLFNGDGGEYTAIITDIQQKKAVVHLTHFQDICRESPCKIHLFHGIARGEKMDWIIQKATELGVQQFTPIRTEKGQIKLDVARTQKKLEHWQRIVIHSSEQCGRNTIMQLHPVLDCQTAMGSASLGLNMICEPSWPDAIPTSLPATPFSLFIGGESGFSPKELEWAQEQKMLACSLGPRILRTETAAIVAVTRLQYHNTDTFRRRGRRGGTGLIGFSN